MYVKSSTFWDCWNFEKSKRYFIGWKFASKKVNTNALIVRHNCIDFKNPKIIMFFGYAHIWHEIHIFQPRLICAWWVISKLLHIFHGSIAHMFRSVQSEFSYILYLKRWMGTIKKSFTFENKHSSTKNFVKNVFQEGWKRNSW